MVLASLTLKVCCTCGDEINLQVKPQCILNQYKILMAGRYAALGAGKYIYDVGMFETFKIKLYISHQRKSFLTKVGDIFLFDKNPVKIIFFGRKYLVFFFSDNPNSHFYCWTLSIL